MSDQNKGVERQKQTDQTKVSDASNKILDEQRDKNQKVDAKELVAKYQDAKQAQQMLDELSTDSPQTQNLIKNATVAQLNIQITTNTLTANVIQQIIQPQITNQIAAAKTNETMSAGSGSGAANE